MINWRSRILFLIIFSLVLLSVTSGYASNGVMKNSIILHLSDREPEVRQSAIRLIEREGDTRAVKALVDLLAVEDNENVRKAAVRALTALTGESLGDDAEKWQEWWDTSGEIKFGQLASPDISPLPEYWNISVVVTIIAILVLVLFMLLFGFMGGYRLKQLKEIMRRSETYVQSAEAATKLSGDLLTELEKKKSELMQFVKNLREETEGEIERFSELLEQNVHHRMREATMSLREKAEKELAQTLSGLKESVGHEVHRSVTEALEKALDELTSRQTTFLADVEAHTLFIEGSFYFIHGKLEEALKYYRKLVHLKPTHYVAWNNMGTILRQMMRFEEALEAYNKALAISQEDAAILYNIAGVYAMQKRKDKMREFLQKAVHLDPELKDEALNDQTFKEYWADEEFKDIAEG